MTAAGLCLASCGVEVVVCPTGYRPVGQLCYPIEEGGAANVGASAADSRAADTGQPAADTGAAPPADASTLDSALRADAAPKPDAAVVDAKADAKPDTKPGGKAPVGAACSDDLDCTAGLACFSWPKGYCTLLDCTVAGVSCPGAAVCWSEAKVTHLCTVQCDGDGDCRTADGYACKRLSQAFGGVDSRLCMPGGKAPHGYGCAKPLDCVGADTCLTDMAGGYCGRLGCSLADACDGGTACVLRGGKPTCLKTCAGDAECQIPTKQSRKCVDGTDLGKKAVKVCLDQSTLAPVGGACLADADCESKVCTVYAKGTCKTGAAPCLADSQCGAGGPCVLDAAAEKGACTSPCSTEKACPTGGLCVPAGGDGFSGTCQPKCQGPGDTKSCGSAPDLDCFYGQPLPSPTASAVPSYACALRPKGSSGANCQIDADCAGGKCFANTQKSAGFCAGKCGPGQPACPFGTTCVDTGLSYCLRMCSGDYDCPDLMTCQSAQGQKVCLQP